MANKIRAGIIGGAGYTAGELTRLLLHHPFAQICFIHSKSHAGKAVHSIHKDLLGETDICFSESFIQDIDVLFLCIGHGEARNFLSENSINEKIKIIDLSQDFRLGGKINNRSFVYGLPELNREAIKAAENIANPGCFATAIQLGLLPLGKAGLLKDIYTTGITGSTGAGQGMTPTSHFSWRANNIQAYKSLQHQHIDEINQSLKQLQATGDINIYFVPWRGDFTRGIYVSSTTDCNLPPEEVHQMYRSFYKGHPFVVVSDTMIDLKQAVNTNKCFVHTEREGKMLVIHTAIDNLLKGASGQAMQNMNLAFGFEETSGLLLKAGYF